VTSDAPSIFRLVLWVALRLAAIVAVVFLAMYLADLAKTALHIDTTDLSDPGTRRAILIGALAYILLTAIPFVPGAEIGMMMLTVFGAAVAPLIYVATIISLCLAFAVGWCVPASVTAAILARLRLRKAATMVTQINALPRADRMAFLTDQITDPRARVLARYRFVALALLINLPGSVIIGGGGGIALVAGLSRLFNPLGFLITILIAVLPVPLTILLFAG
jgi:hypothetical protein